MCENESVVVGIKDKPKRKKLECATLMSSSNPMTKICMYMFVWIRMCTCVGVWEYEYECVYEYKWESICEWEYVY